MKDKASALKILSLPWEKEKTEKYITSHHSVRTRMEVYGLVICVTFNHALDCPGPQFCHSQMGITSPVLPTGQQPHLKGNDVDGSK